MKLWVIYIDGKYAGCVEADSRSVAGDRAIEKYPVKISSKLQIIESFCSSQAIENK